MSNFGASGPLRDWLGSDLVFQAMGGVAQISGVSDREPLKRGLRQTLWCAGINAAYASLAGYLAAQRTGAGAHIDLAIRDCPASELVLNEAFFACMGAVQGRRPAAQRPARRAARRRRPAAGARADTSRSRSPRRYPSAASPSCSASRG